jgi:hypothetical protein
MNLAKLGEYLCRLGFRYRRDLIGSLSTGRLAGNGSATMAGVFGI